MAPGWWQSNGNRAMEQREPFAFEEEAWYGAEGMGWLEPDNTPTTISYEEAQQRMES